MVRASRRPALGYVAVALLAWTAAARPAHGQEPDLEAIRDQLRQDLREVEFAGSFAGLIVVTDELELSGARYALEDETDSRLGVLALPFKQVLHPWADARTGLYLEGAIGYGRATQNSPDLYGGALEGLATRVDAAWNTYGGLLGIGPWAEPLEDLSVALLGNVGLARITSVADYGGPGAAFSAELADGIAFNWGAWAVSGGGAARVEWDRDLGGAFGLKLLGRYDLRWTRTFAADDPAQEFTNRLQVVTLRGDLFGPTGLRPFDLPVGWRAFGGYRHFLEDSVLDVRDFVQVGGALEVGVSEVLPVLSMLSVNGSLIFGGVVSGWSAGVGFAF